MKAVIGHSGMFNRLNGIIFGLPADPKTFVGPVFDGEPARSGNSKHIANRLSVRATVAAIHVAALADGGTDEGAPGLRPHYHTNYHGSYVRDTDGNKLQAICHSATGERAAGLTARGLATKCAPRLTGGPFV